MIIPHSGSMCSPNLLSEHPIPSLVLLEANPPLFRYPTIGTPDTL